MPPRKRAKKAGSSKKLSGVDAKQNVASVAQATPHFPPSASIALLPFPHILLSIMDYATNPTLYALMRCSKQLRYLAAPKLYRYIRVTQTQFSACVEAGGRGSLSETDGHTSPLPTRYLQNVRSIEFKNYRPSRASSNLAVGSCFANVSTVVLQPTFHWRGRDAFSISVQADERALKPKDIIIRYTESFLEFWPGMFMPITNIPQETQDVTILIPCAWRIAQFPTIFPDWADSAGEGKTMTVVLLPSHPRLKEGRDWSNMDRMWYLLWYRPGRLSYPFPPSLAIRIVGLEYLDVAPAPEILLAQLPPTERGPTFERFSEWLDKLPDPRSLFTVEEEARLRRADKEILEQQEARFMAIDV